LLFALPRGEGKKGEVDLIATHCAEEKGRRRLPFAVYPARINRGRREREAKSASEAFLSEGEEKGGEVPPLHLNQTGKKKGK